MKKTAGKKSPIINRDVVTVWVILSILGFVAYIYFGFHPIGSWIWNNIIYVNHPDKVLFVPANTSKFYLIYWIVVVLGFYIVVFSILIILPSYLYLRYKNKKSKPEEEELIP